MANVTHSAFARKKADPSKLIRFGFELAENCYVYRRIFPGCGFEASVFISPQGHITSQIIDPESGEEYALHLVPEALGSFVGSVKAQYEQMLEDIAAHCFDEDVFKTEQAKQIIGYVNQFYNDSLEFLWQKLPDNAIWRRKDTGKWYAALLTVSARKLGLDDDNLCEIIDLRCKQEKLPALLENKNYYPGYHMNKKSWFTIILNDTIELSEICQRIDESYLLAT